VKIWALSLLIVLSITISCGKAPDSSFKISDVNLHIKDIEIISTKMFEGFLLGTDFDRNELYVQSLYPDDFYSIGIIDLETGNVIKTFKRRKGSSQSPTDLYNPAYMQFLDNKYYLVDWFHKILVFDHKLSYLYTNIFHIPRYFIDFYKRNGKQFFVLGNRRFRPKKTNCLVEIYQMIERRRQKSRKKLYETSHKALYYTWDSKRPLYGVLWSSSWGFEKDGKIYFANSNEKQYFVYDLEKENLAAVELHYLKGKKYSDKDAITLCMSKCYIADFDDDNITLKAHPDKLYYFGFYDVGENKIGIAGDLGLEKTNFRLDIFKADSREYLKSIWLPLGHGFLRRLIFNARGLFLTRIDVDKGIYVWMDVEGEVEDFEFTVKLTRFRIKNGNR